MDYAGFVFATLAGVAAGPEGVPERHEQMQVRFGHNAAGKHGPGKGGVVSMEVLAAGSGSRLFWAVGGSGDGMQYAGIGLARTIDWGRFRLQPSFCPTLYLSGRGTGGAERVQFRTSMELQYRALQGITLGVGFFHISNAGLSPYSAGVDVVYGSLQFRH